MKNCPNCATSNPPQARYCMACGHRLGSTDDNGNGYKAGISPGGMTVFVLSVLGSLLLSFILIVVFRLPVFIFAAFLPLLWHFRPKK